MEGALKGLKAHADGSLHRVVLYMNIYESFGLFLRLSSPDGRGGFCPRGWSRPEIQQSARRAILTLTYPLDILSTFPRPISLTALDHGTPHFNTPVGNGCGLYDPHRPRPFSPAYTCLVAE